jgi:hypothetical protein
VSQRRDIRLALADRLTAIRQTNGFSCDAGLPPIQHTRFPISEEDVKPRLALVPGDATAVEESDIADGARRVVWPFTVTGVLDVDPNEPDSELAAEDLLADIRRALFLATDLTPGATPLGGLVDEIRELGGERIVGREAGGKLVSVVVPCAVVFNEPRGGA